MLITKKKKKLLGQRHQETGYCFSVLSRPETEDFFGLPLTSLVSKSSSLSSTTILYVLARGAPNERMCSYWKTSSGLPSPRLYTDTASALTPSHRSWGKPPSLHCGRESGAGSDRAAIRSLEPRKHQAGLGVSTRHEAELVQGAFMPGGGEGSMRNTLSLAILIGFWLVNRSCIFGKTSSHTDSSPLDSATLWVISVS